MRILRKNSFKNKFDFEFIYPTIHDAVCSVTDKTYLNLNKNRFEDEIDKIKAGDDEEEIEKQTQNINQVEKKLDEEFNYQYLSRF